MALYLVTGVAGFIGSNLARELVRRGDKVRGFDNFETGKRENLAGLSPKIEFRELDLLDARGVAEFCHGVDYILHQAAIPSVPRSVQDPVSSHNANITGTLNVLMGAREARVKRVVYAASSSAYGDTPTLPKDEAMLPNPISPYAVQKLAGELYLSSFYRVYGLETVSLRYFNIFGPYQDPTSQYSGVLAKFITQMLAGKPSTIFGDGEQSRDFTYVENAVNANLLACKAPAEKVAGGVFNVATATRFSLNETFLTLAEIIGYKGEPQYVAPRAGDVKHSLADISRTREAMGYEPTVGFENGLRRTVEWYKQALVSAGSTSS
ncbi:MAG TPA: SDR family oxidoreductase [Terriglobales bacterium]|jgi:nucleoside-diphosphate-sugar epimerase|nr:SDR family oxidoreductase [Terriglobales bacterium]